MENEQSAKRGCMRSERENLKAATHEELGAGAPGNVGRPQVEVLPALPALEQQALVAVLHLRDLVDDEERVLALHLRVRPRVRHQRAEVVHEVAVAVPDAAGAEDQDALLVRPFPTLRMKKRGQHLLIWTTRLDEPV